MRSGNTCRPSQQAVHAAQHVVGEQRAVGQHDALDRAVRDVALVPQRHVLQARLQVAAQHARQAADGLGADRVALVRHRAGALLPGLEPLLHLAHLGALQVPQLDRDRAPSWRPPTRTRRGTRRGGRGRSTCVAGTGVRPSAAATCASIAGSMLLYVPTAPLSLHTATVSRRGMQARAIAVHLQRPQRHLRAERGGLGVDAVRAADHHRVAVLARQQHERAQQLRRRAAISRSHASRIIQHHAVSTTSLLVRP